VLDTKGKPVAQKHDEDFVEGISDAFVAVAVDPMGNFAAAGRCYRESDKHFLVAVALYDKQGNLVAKGVDEIRN
jgi:hypothetical protein